VAERWRGIFAACKERIAANIGDIGKIFNAAGGKKNRQRDLSEFSNGLSALIGFNFPCRGCIELSWMYKTLPLTI
jgi:hypothetical protein